MPLGNQYSASAVLDVLEAMEQSVSGYAQSAPSIPPDSLVDLLKDTLQIVEESRVRRPREKQDFEELRDKVLGSWEAAFRLGAVKE